MHSWFQLDNYGVDIYHKGKINIEITDRHWWKCWPEEKFSLIDNLCYQWARITYVWWKYIEHGIWDGALLLWYELRFGDGHWNWWDANYPQVRRFLKKIGFIKFCCKLRGYPYEEK